MKPNAFYQDTDLGSVTYDLFYDQATWRDIPFYLEYAQRFGGPVLELGTGTGRVAWPLAKSGVEVVGLDSSDRMLAVAQAKSRDHDADVSDRVTFGIGDMADFSLDRQFPLVIVAARSFQHLITPEAQQQSLIKIREHLDPDGRVLLHLFDPRLDLCAPNIDITDEVEEGVDPSSGNTVRRHIATRTADPLMQTLESTITIQVCDRNGAVVKEEQATWALRWTYQQEMRYLLEHCGYRIEAEYSDFANSPPAYGREQIWVAQAV